MLHKPVAVMADDITSQAFMMFSFVVRTTSISVCLFVVFFFKFYLGSTSLGLITAP